jgi:hypothetical protein
MKLVPIAWSPLDAWRGSGKNPRLSISESKDLILSISRMEAVIVKNSGTQTTVKCPYCNKLHKHGNAGKPDLIGDTRSSHCLKGTGGEYNIKG